MSGLFENWWFISELAKIYAQKNKIGHPAMRMDGKGERGEWRERRGKVGKEGKGGNASSKPIANSM